MNWNLGLRRLSAAVWAVVGLWLLALSSVAYLDGAGGLWTGLTCSAGAVAVPYGLHRLTRWVVGGFFQQT